MAFDTVLVANRGEIALRIIRACKGLGLRCVAVFSEADRGASYLALADEAVCIGPAPAKASYLDGDAIIMAALATGAQAVHPGYGFLAENAGFAEAVEAAGLTFIGPSAPVIRLMGDKITAKQAMRRAGIPCVPGSEGALLDDPADCVAQAEAIGFPVIIKAAGGGGGRGMRVVHDAASLVDAIATTRQEAAQAFSNGDVYLEKFLQAPRHVEIQVLCDQHGQALWLGERDCSVQRRHQKVIEEAPAPGIDRALVTALGERCVAACLAIGYRGVGTFEFLYEDGVFAFIEMNTRIQVEHPVTEQVTGIDIVQQQVLVARGEKLSLRQADIVIRGHAIECRVNAEDGFTGRPSPGEITAWHAPGGPGLRLDSHIQPKSRVPAYYDSLMAKLIVHAPDRAQCIARMRAALAEMSVAGVESNLALQREILADPEFAKGSVSIHYLEERLRQRGPETVTA